MIDQPPGPVEPTDSARYVSEEKERLRALADVLREQAARVEAARLAEARRYRRARIRRRTLVATWVGVAYVWLATPSWLRIQPPPTPTVGEEAQSLRVSVFLQSQAIEAYRLERGRLPYVLQEAGPPFRGMEYRRRDSRTYELHGRSDRVILRYSSEQPPLDFVGGASDRLLSVPGGAGGGTR
jgi:hypothetical protein